MLMVSTITPATAGRVLLEFAARLVRLLYVTFLLHFVVVVVVVVVLFFSTKCR